MKMSRKNKSSDGRISRRYNQKCERMGIIKDSEGEREKSSYIMMISNEDFFLNWSDVFSQKIKPLRFHSNLIHVDVSCGYIFISCIQSLILNQIEKEGGWLISCFYDDTRSRDFFLSHHQNHKCQAKRVPHIRFDIHADDLQTGSHSG